MTLADDLRKLADSDLTALGFKGNSGRLSSLCAALRQAASQLESYERRVAKLREGLEAMTRFSCSRSCGSEESETACPQCEAYDVLEADDKETTT